MLSWWYERSIIIYDRQNYYKCFNQYQCNATKKLACSESESKKACVKSLLGLLFAYWTLRWLSTGKCIPLCMYVFMCISSCLYVCMEDVVQLFSLAFTVTDNACKFQRLDNQHLHTHSKVSALATHNKILHNARPVADHLQGRGGEYRMVFETNLPNKG